MSKPLELRKKIGEKLKKARIEKGLSQEALGKLIGVTHPAIGSYERGRLRITIEMLVVFSQLLEKPFSYFIEDDKEIVEKFKKEKESVKLDNYNLDDNLEFSLEMSLRNYLKSKINSDLLNEEVDKIMKFIKEKTSHKV